MITSIGLRELKEEIDRGRKLFLQKSLYDLATKQLELTVSRTSCGEGKNLCVVDAVADPGNAHNYCNGTTHEIHAVTYYHDIDRLKICLAVGGAMTFYVDAIA